MSREISKKIRSKRSSPGRYGEAAYTEEEARYGLEQAQEKLRATNLQANKTNTGPREIIAARAEQGSLKLTLDYYRKALSDVLNKIMYKGK